MEFKSPSSLKAEHDELHADLKHAIAAGGKTGEAARAVARLLHEHFVKEEQFAIPPLALLAPLARGEVTPEMSGVLALTGKLEAEMPQMLAEHAAIVRALDHLAEAAKSDGKSDVEAFAARLKLHARTEEEVMYPAAILVGKFVAKMAGTA